MKIRYGVCGALLASLLLLLPAAAADSITEREKHDCRGDYHRYCSEYGLGTEALRACMSRSVKKISNMCVAALVDGGEMTQAQANKLRAKVKTTTKSTHKGKTTKKPTHNKVAHKTSKKTN